MCPIQEISPRALRRRCPPEALPFETTASAKVQNEFVGQERAVEAVRFGLLVRHHGYNLFAAGPHGVGKRTIVEQLLHRQALGEPPPDDWCYLHDLSGAGRPVALRLPPGRGQKFAAAMAQMVEDLEVALLSAFESHKYRTALRQLAAEQDEFQQTQLQKLEKEARGKKVGITSAQGDFLVIPLGPEGPLSPEEVLALPDAEQERLNEHLEATRDQLRELLERFQVHGRQLRQARRQLDRTTVADSAVGALKAVRREFADIAAVVTHLAAVERDIVDTGAKLAEVEGEDEESTRLLEAFEERKSDGTPLGRRYLVNLVVPPSPNGHPPVVFADNPTCANLVGRVEQPPVPAEAPADYRRIVPGALHRALGGYLLLDAESLLESPFGWRTLKRVLKSGEIGMDPLDESDRSNPMPTLRPEPIALGNTKVVLLGEPLVYYQLSAADPEFVELFKVLTEFDDRTDWTPQTQGEYSLVIASLVAREGLKPFDRSAVARVIEHAARLAEDSQCLSLRLRPVTDLLIESDAWATRADASVVEAAHVQQALEAQVQRCGKERQRVLDSVRRGTVFIDTEGERIGQVNGLVVASVGEAKFGHALRITARVRVGPGDVVDIEREVELGGPIHSKGVLLLSGFLGSRYAQGFPLALSASIGLEQSYVPIEGDSATLAEACAVLSALAKAPIDQAWAVTGSMNQNGDVQAIGGVNEKIEGFFDLCRARGLSGRQGVLIPKSNLDHLMLRQDVVAAVEHGQFRVATVSTVDEALQVLTATPAGQLGANGEFESGSLNASIRKALKGFAEQASHFATARELRRCLSERAPSDGH